MSADFVLLAHITGGSEVVFVVANRVKETSTTTGTGTYTLGGAVTNFQTFGSAMANGDTCHYAAVDSGGAGWETGKGTWNTGGTLTRTTIFSSSNNNNAVSWAAGTRYIFITAQPSAAANMGVTAAGTTRGTATQVTSHVVRISGGAADTGIYFAATLDQIMVRVKNDTASTKKIYPGSGGAVDGGTTDEAHQLQAGLTGNYFVDGVNLWTF